MNRPTIMDYEKSIHNAFVSVFENSQICGCLFHLGQACWRKINDIGERVRYNTHDDFSLKIKCFTALAFLPTEDVIEAFENLSDDDDIPDEFITYFETNYIGINRGRGSRQRRSEPLFPIKIWNVRERILANIPRSNNAVEGYHNAIRSSVTSVHPNLWKLCGALAKEEAMAQAKIAHFRRGDSVKRKKKYEVIDIRLTKFNLCDFHFKHPVDYLD